MKVEAGDWVLGIGEPLNPNPKSPAKNSQLFLLCEQLLQFRSCDRALYQHIFPALIVRHSQELFVLRRRQSNHLDTCFEKNGAFLFCKIIKLSNDLFFCFRGCFCQKILKLLGELIPRAEVHQERVWDLVKARVYDIFCLLIPAPIANPNGRPRRGGRMTKGWIVMLGLSVTLAGTARGTDANGDGFLQQSRGSGHPSDIDEWRKGEDRGGLKPYPAAPPGVPNPPGGLFQFGGSATSSFAGPDLGMPFAEWRAKMEKQWPGVDRAARAVLDSRYRLDCITDKQATMSRGKPLPVGPTGRLPKGVDSWEKYAAQSS